jgi:hypothetical protein
MKKERVALALIAGSYVILATGCESLSDMVAMEAQGEPVTEVPS